MKKVGYTAGVFDMFHIGHLNILQKAKQQCDFLIVAVSSDELCYQYKHKYPIVPLSQRLAIISELKCTDMVVIQEDMDKVKAAKKYNVNEMYVGTDWKGTTAWNKYESDLENINCKVVYIDYTSGISSSIIKERIIKD